MRLPKDEWIEKLNAFYSDQDVSHKQRPFLAWGEWAQQCDLWLPLDDPGVNRIFEWFKQHAKPGAHAIGPIFVGALHFDAAIWPIFVPVGYGEFALQLNRSLRTMPEKIYSRLATNARAIQEACAVWADCIDYGYGIDQFRGPAKVDPMTYRMLKSGDKELRAAVDLLIAARPTQKAMETSRLAVEMFLKAFLASAKGLTDKEARKFGHNMDALLTECLVASPASELRVISGKLKMFPDVNARYEPGEFKLRELWYGYALAQSIASTLIRDLTGRDCRKTLKVEYQK